MTLNFILAPSFHGATLLSLLLNNHSEIVSLGDAVPSRTVDQMCACSRRVSQCSFWHSIAERVDAERFTADEGLLPAAPRICATNSHNRLFNKALIISGVLLGRWVWSLAPHARDDFTDVWLRFYQAVCELTGAEMFIDGNKSLMKMLALKSALGSKAQVKIVHLVRNPNGFHNSNLKYDPSVSVATSAAIWKGYHRQVEWVSRLAGVESNTLRYESLTENPNAAMERLFTFFGVPSERVIKPPQVAAKHHLMGNQMLFHFDGVIKQDVAWKKNLGTADQEQIIALTSPLYERYGYTVDG